MYIHSFYHKEPAGSDSHPHYVITSTGASTLFTRPALQCKIGETEEAFAFYQEHVTLITYP